MFSLYFDYLLGISLFGFRAGFEFLLLLSLIFAHFFLLIIDENFDILITAFN